MRVKSADGLDAVEVIRLRSTAINSRVGVGLAIAGLIGVLAGLAPSGYLGLENGPGVIGGAFLGIVGVSACCPLWLPYLISIEVAGDVGRGVSRDFYLVSAPLVLLRCGAVVAALRVWLRMLGMGALCATLVGVGSGFRDGNLLGSALLSGRFALLAMTVTVYVAVVSTAASMLNSRAWVAPVLFVISTMASFFLVPPLRESGIEALLALSPMTPVMSVLGPETVGRFSLELSPMVAISEALVWVVASAAFLMLRAKRP